MLGPQDSADKALRMVREAPELVYDTETSGLDWKRNFPIGYVIGANDREVVYIPVRHGGGGNLPGADIPETATGTWGVHPFERELAKAFADRIQNGIGRVIGHYIKFDAHFSANAGIMLGRNLSCTQNNEALLNEYSRSFSLDACAKAHGVQAKKGDDLYQHISSLFGCAPDKKSMSNYWRLSGNDQMAVEYAIGDGVSTIQVFWDQLKQIKEQELHQVFDLENQLIWTLFRMERRGFKVDTEYLGRLAEFLDGRIKTAIKSLPSGFNTRSPKDVREWVERAGHTDWPVTEKGNPSFKEKWLEGFEDGKHVVAVRKWTNLRNTWVKPMMDEHVWKGRVHTNLNQLKADDFGTVSGRLSCSAPSLHGTPKRDKETGSLLRRCYVADEGHLLWDDDYSQCLAAGTQVSVPGGTKNIEDINPGDWVYSYNASRRLVLKKVSWAGQTGMMPLARLHWKTNGRTTGYLDATANHPIRLKDGRYKTVQELAGVKSKKKGANPYWIETLALRQRVVETKGYKTPYIYPTGGIRMKESRFVFEQVNGWLPEIVHHHDDDSTNNNPRNLKAMTKVVHNSHHDTFGMGALTPEQRKERSLIATKALQAKFNGRNNHAITHIVPLEGIHPVYDLTVEDTHNFIANEICVHNCEPRLYGHYSEEPAIVDGYNQTPFKDMHAVVAEMLDVERDPTAKRMNMGILTGMYPKSFAGHMDWDIAQATEKWDAWFEAFPTVRDFQELGKRVLRERGFVRTLLGRKCRLEKPRFAYRAVSKIIQGGNADILKWFMLKLDIMCEQAGDVANMLLSIHDAFQWQSPDNPEGEAFAKVMEKEMCRVQEAPFNLKVPFVIDSGSGKDWARATYGEKALDYIGEID